MEVFAHSSLVAIFSHLAHEAFYITANRSRGFDQIAVFERALMREQIIMHLPKLPLRTGRLCCFCCMHRIRVRFSQREVPEGEEQGVRQRPPERL
jgi:hypothetical protein